jgi:hypothetical protein
MLGAVTALNFEFSALSRFRSSESSKEHLQYLPTNLLAAAHRISVRSGEDDRVESFYLIMHQLPMHLIQTHRYTMWALGTRWHMVAPHRQLTTLELLLEKFFFFLSNDSWFFVSTDSMRTTIRLAIPNRLYASCMTRRLAHKRHRRNGIVLRWCRVRV